MAQIEDFWRIVTPASRKQLYTTVATDAYDPRNADMMGTSVASVSWYSQVMRGLGTRMNSYKQFDNMDNDIDIARSLDIIAEEMSGKDDQTNLPFQISYQKEENQEVSDTTVITIRQALRQWAKTQDLNRRVFSIARCLIKYGDCFFRKTSDTKKWIYIDPSLVQGIGLDALGDTVNYHVKKPAAPSPLGMQAHREEIDIIPASAIIHFTLSDDMGDSAPFGQSILRPVYRTFSQLTMLENAIIIYRIVRAPERRVFYIDTGNMPPQRVKQYLNQIKDEIRQKRVPGVSGGKSVVDGQVDVNSIQEDMFFPVSASGRGSRVETLPGGTEDFGTATLKLFQDKIFRGLRIPTSYMTGQDGAQAQSNDGKVGIAYIEELRFAQFVKRLQDRLDELFDREFKIYMKVVGLQVDDEIFSIKLPEPSNFALYKQAALDAELINSYNNVKEDETLSKRFILHRYLGLTDDEIQMNEVMVKEERGITDTNEYSAMRQIYDPAIYKNRKEIFIDEEDDGTGGSDDMVGDEEGEYDGSGGEPGFFADTDTPEPAASPDAELDAEVAADEPVETEPAVPTT